MEISQEREPLQEKARVSDPREAYRLSHGTHSSLHDMHRSLAKVVEAKKVGGVHEEVRELFSLTGAFFVSSVSWVAMKATDTALLGHVGTRYLDASAYSDLYTSSTGVFIRGQVLGVFCAQAFGAGNYALVGTWLKVSYVVLFVAGVPVMIAWLCTGPALEAFGVADARLRADAASYAMILAVSIPAQIGFSQLSQFFSSQQLMRPSFVTSPAAMMLNIVAGVIFVLGIGKFRGFGFVACPTVTTAVEYFQLAFVIVAFCVVGRLHDRCRPAVGFFSLSDVTTARVARYVKMYVPAALAAASDFWRMSVVGAFAATLSEYDLGVFNASYRIMWLSLTFAMSLGSAIGTRLGAELGAGDARGAKTLVNIGLSTAFLLILLLAAIVAAVPRQLGMIFTDDAVLLDKFERCRYSLAATVLFMNLAVVLERVPIACGQTNLVLACGFVGSWLGQVPAVWLCLAFWQRSLQSVYVGVCLGYAILCALYAILVVTADFNKIADDAKARSEKLTDDGPPLEL
ncbi:hypothetical protein CTAYLR_004251 [Chrysophaeum taylorii]|uniref:Multidrug and toxic compound extrusion protein n=1 Tax=Chrysophaeum taylorii TaxID=2483200 RepID=A0AAD7UCC4_9STRA|nr:hypothetical protein CTAYLR_004251 [Chrysophaeum taylorii]